MRRKDSKVVRYMYSRSTKKKFYIVTIRFLGSLHTNISLDIFNSTENALLKHMYKSEKMIFNKRHEHSPEKKFLANAVRQ